MITVEEAFHRIVETATPLTTEKVPLSECSGRVLAAPLVARRTQPGSDMSAMDGYAVRSADLKGSAVTLTVVGESTAGTPFAGTCAAGHAVRIFTGATVPEGCDQVVVQEDCERDGDTIHTHMQPSPGRHIRLSGIDFAERQTVMEMGSYISPRSIGLIAGAGYDQLMVHRAPRVAILSTGDELVSPGAETFSPYETVNSSTPQIAAMLKDAGAHISYIGQARDDLKALRSELSKAIQNADILLTIGGASVGERDLIQQALGQEGMSLDFWKVRMRPGKPLIHGAIGQTRILGLPGNPVSAFVCALLFARPLVDRLMGRPAPLPAGIPLPLATDLPANGGRQHYLRARLIGEPGKRTLDPAVSQDSSLVSVLAQSDGLIVRAPDAPAASAGEMLPFIPF